MERGKKKKGDIDIYIFIYHVHPHARAAAIIAYANYFDINGLKPDRNKGRDKLPCESHGEQTVHALN